jgi:hypothetical protein
VVDTASATGRPGVFAAGNLVHPVETADLCALGGQHAAESILAHMRDDAAAGPTVATRVEGPIAWVSPQVVRLGHPPVRGAFMLRASAVAPRARVEVSQGARILHRARVRGGLLPGRPVHVGSGWMSDVDPTQPVTFRAVVRD